MPVLEIESTLTDRYQTTIPAPVRRALKLRKRDKLVYKVLDDGTVVLTRRAEADEADPVLGRFLDFLARDMAAHPERLRGIDRDFVARIQLLVKDVEVDRDAPLSPDDECARRRRRSSTAGQSSRTCASSTSSRRS